MKPDAQPAGTGLTRLIAGLLAALFVLTALAGLVLFNVERGAFDPAIYERAMVSQNFYGQYSSLISDLLVRNMGGNAPAFLGHLSANQWKLLVDAVMPEQTLRSMTENAIDQFFAYINGETDTPRISLLPLKNSLAGPAGLNAALAILRSQPDCTVQQIMKILITIGGELCNPPREVIDLLQPVMQAQLRVAASALPDGVALLTTSQKASVEPLLKGLKLFRLFMRLSLIIPVSLLIIITLMAVRTFKSFLGWWGWPFLITGLLGMPLGLTGAPFFRWLIERWLYSQTSITFPPEVTVPIRAVLDSALREILNPVAWESLVLFILGLCMILLSANLSSIRKKEPMASRTGSRIT